MTEPLIRLADFTYSYPGSSTPALNNIDLSVFPGELVGVIGPSGAGKSSLAYTLSGFIPHFYQGEVSGEQYFSGKKMTDQSLGELAGRIGMVVQNPFNQISGARYTVREEIAFGLENLGIEREEMRTRVEVVLDQFNLSSQADRSPFELSGGQQQRLALASIIAMEPELLILDEPTSQLDPAGSEDVFEAVHELTKDNETAVVIISHQLEWLAEFSSRVITLFKGRISLEGKPDKILTDGRLEDWGVGTTRYTQAAKLARQQEIISIDQLPVTLDQTARAFQIK